MKITYTGSPAELLPKERAKIEAKLGKIGKVIDRKGEKEAHVIVSQVRHLHKAEITMNAYDHALVGVGSNGDLFTAMSAAIEKLEKQLLKIRTKWRDTHRDPLVKQSPPSPEPAAAPGKKAVKPVKTAAPKTAKGNPKVFRVNHSDGRKPMTLEEATLEIGAGQDYVVYRDAKTDKLCTLVRRGDGHLDLIES